MTRDRDLARCVIKAEEKNVTKKICTMHGIKGTLRKWKAYKAKELNEPKWLHFLYCTFREIATALVFICPV